MRSVAGSGFIFSLLALTACSGRKVTDEVTTTHEACEVFCDLMIECGPSWAHEYRNRENCSWKFGEDAAYETCMMSCEQEEVEMYDEEDEMDCILCMVDEIGSTCRSGADALDACPCLFENESYGGTLAPAIEPLTCNGGDEYVFSDNEIGPYLRELCLEGNIVYCQ